MILHEWILDAFVRSSAGIFMPVFYLLIDYAVAFARGSFQTGAIFDGDLTAFIGDQAGFVEGARGDGDACTARAEHMRDKFLGQLESAFPDTILAHEQLARQAFADRMEAVAGGNLA